MNKDIEQGIFFFPATSISDNCSVWEKNFEEEFHKPLKNYETLKAEAKKLYCNDSKPLTARYISEKIATEPQKIDGKIDLIITKLKDLKWTKAITE